MAIGNIVLWNSATLPDPLNITMETAVISGNLHKIYLKVAAGCTNLVTNSGAAGTTDWVDSNSDGLADDWAKGSYNNSRYSASIVTGNGFAGNAQRMTVVTSSSTLYYLRYATPIALTGQNYQCTFKYRSSALLSIIAETSAQNSWGQWATFTANTGNAISATVSCRQWNGTVGDTGYIGFGFYYTANVNDYFEMDEVVFCAC